MSDTKKDWVLRECYGGVTSIEDWNGVPWGDAPIPSRHHICVAQTKLFVVNGGVTYICACGATSRNQISWERRNSRHPLPDETCPEIDHAWATVPRDEPGSVPPASVPAAVPPVAVTELLVTEWGWAAVMWSLAVGAVLGMIVAAWFGLVA